MACIRIESTDGNLGTRKKVAIPIPIVTCTLPIPIPMFGIFVFPFPCTSLHRCVRGRVHRCVLCTRLFTRPYNGGLLAVYICTPSSQPCTRPCSRPVHGRAVYTRVHGCEQGLCTGVRRCTRPWSGHGPCTLRVHDHVDGRVHGGVTAVYTEV